MTSIEAERLCAYVDGVLAWRRGEPTARPQWDLTPSDLLPTLDEPRRRELLEKTPLGIAVLNTPDELAWAERHRCALAKVRRFTTWVPSITRDPLLQHCTDPRAGLADVYQWCQDAVKMLDGMESIDSVSEPSAAEDQPTLVGSLTPRQIEILQAIDEFPGRRTIEIIADAAGHGKAVVGKDLQALAGRAIVVRDGKRKPYRLTQAGEQLLRTIRSQSER